jgi:hypothetical protein
MKTERPANAGLFYVSIRHPRPLLHREARRLQDPVIGAADEDLDPRRGRHGCRIPEDLAADGEQRPVAVIGRLRRLITNESSAPRATTASTGSSEVLSVLAFWTRTGVTRFGMSSATSAGAAAAAVPAPATPIVRAAAKAASTALGNMRLWYIATPWKGWVRPARSADAAEPNRGPASRC